MKATTSPARLVNTRADAWLIVCKGTDPLLPGGQNPALKRLARMARDWIKSCGFKGKAGETTSFPSWETLPARMVILAGIGEDPASAPLGIMKAAGAAAQVARKNKAARMAVSMESVTRLTGVPTSVFVESVVCGAAGGFYRFNRYMSKGQDNGKKPHKLDIVFCDARAGKASAEVRDAEALADTINAVRDIANLPPNDAPPRAIASAAAALAKRFGLSCSVLGRRELEKKGCRAMLAVGQGSKHDARLVTLKYKGRDPKMEPVVLVGKTITFDTGGISLKPAKSMEWMKYDKCGGMAVLAATVAAARLRLRRPVIGILAAAENMPGGGASRPGDIVRAYSGKTIEILNTDAEGRLALADALAIAAEYKPAAIVDLATLTGACIAALGYVLAGVMGNDKNLLAALTASGERTGDRLWTLPLLPDYDDDIRGDFSDLKNVGPGGAGTIIGGIFLQHFVPKGIPWAHLDIAGTAYIEKNRSWAAAGATLFGARLLVDWIRQIEKKN